MEVTATGTDVKVEAAQLTELTVLLERIMGGLRDLDPDSVDTVDVEALKKDIDDLPARILELSADLKAKNDFCLELSRKLKREASRQETFKLWSEQPSLAEEIRTTLSQAHQKVQETKGLLETLFKIGSLRGRLAQVEKEPARRAMGKALTTTAIVIEKIFQSQKDLETALALLDRRGVQEKLVPPAAPAAPAASGSASGADATAIAESPPVLEVLQLTPPAPLPGAAPRPAAPPQEGAQAHAHGHHAEPHEAGAASEDVHVESDAAEVSHQDFQRIRGALNRWSKWNPLAASHLGARVRIVSARSEKAVRLRIEALWGERRRVEATKPFPGRAPDTARLASLWELPAAPPRDYREVTQKQRIPGEERIVDCPACQGNPRPSCRKCQGKRLLAYHSCETRYAPSRLDEVQYGGDLPPALLRTAGGQLLFRESFSALKSQTLEPGVETKCVEEAARWLDPYFLREIVEPFYGQRGADGSGPSRDEGSVERRLVRTKIEIVSVPVLRLECAFKEPGQRVGPAQFQVWFYGVEQRVHTSELPRVWTWKASAAVAGLLAAGAGLGSMLARIV